MVHLKFLNFFVLPSILFAGQLYASDSNAIEFQYSKLVQMAKEAGIPYSYPDSEFIYGFSEPLEKKCLLIPIEDTNTTHFKSQKDISEPLKIQFLSQ